MCYRTVNIRNWRFLLEMVYITIDNHLFLQ